MKAIDPAELIRFIISGLTATLGNMAAVRLVRFALPYETALLVGLVAGVSISFTLSKVFAFGSKSWSKAPREALRFLLVYGVGSALYWVAAVTVARVGLGLGLSTLVSENGGIIAGGGVMMVTSYLG